MLVRAFCVMVAQIGLDLYFHCVIRSFSKDATLLAVHSVFCPVLPLPNFLIQ